MMMLKKGWRADAGESNFLEQQSEAALVTSARLFTSDLLCTAVQQSGQQRVQQSVQQSVHCTQERSALLAGVH